MVRLVSLQEGPGRNFSVASPGTPTGDWTDYFAGVAWSLSETGVALRGVAAVVDSDVPIGSGLSSSAASSWPRPGRCPPPFRHRSTEPAWLAPLSVPRTSSWASRAA